MERASQRVSLLTHRTRSYRDSSKNVFAEDGDKDSFLVVRLLDFVFDPALIGQAFQSAIILSASVMLMSFSGIA